MPSAAQILEGLTGVANAFWPIAVAWHMVAGAALLAVARGWRPERRFTAVVLALPAASVSLAAFTTGNPFNGATFALITLLLALSGARRPRDAASAGPRWAAVAGVLGVAYAWVYPHFLAPAWLSVIAAPIGLVPCPTLALILGAGLLAGGFGSRAWSVTAAGAGLFYGLFGALRLGVWLDVGLVALAAAMLVLAFAKKAAPRSRRWVELHSV